MTVYAAGAVLWREEKGELRVLLVHRGRYNDWAWPKGKQESGEHLLATAVREVREETGLKVSLGIKLDVLKYDLPNGEPKEVHYWVAKVTDKALASSKFKPDEEVAEVKWFTPEEARAKLTYPADAVYLDAVIQLHARGELRTKPVIVLRHAKATPRSDWKKGEASRPLLEIGTQQAKSLVPMLGAFGIKKVISSPWKRCRTTVAPFAKSRGISVTERTQISEFGNHKGPQRTAKLLAEVVEDAVATVVCSHRPALPTILETIGKSGTEHQAKMLAEFSTLKPGDFVVAHLTVPNKKEKRKIVSVEHYSTGIDD